MVNIYLKLLFAAAWTELKLKGKRTKGPKAGPFKKKGMPKKANTNKLVL